MKRKITITLIVIGVVCAALIGGLELYLRSSSVTRLVVAHLEAMYGARLNFKSVNIGLTATTIEGLELFEPGPDAPADPWLTVDSARAAIYLWQLDEANAMPTSIALDGARMLLRFDRNGNLLTHIPPKLQSGALTPHLNVLPAVVFQNSEITVRKEHCGDLSLKDVDARFHDDQGHFNFAGSADSRELGELAFKGAIQMQSGIADLHFQSRTPGQVAAQSLEAIPFLPASLWRELQVADAKVRADFTANYDWHHKSLRFHGSLDASDAKLIAPSVQLAASDVRAKLILDERKVRLRACTGRTLGGSFSTHGELDYADPDKTLTLTDLQLEGLNIQDLPEAWHVPTLVRKAVANGKLFGAASVSVSYRPGILSAGAVGSLVGLAAPAAGLAVSEWAEPAAWITALPEPSIKVHGHGQGEVRDPSGKNSSVKFDWNLAPPSGPIASNTTLIPNDAANAKAMFTIFATPTLVSFQDDAQKPSNKAQDSLELTFNLHNADVAQFVKNQGLQLPFPVDGKASMHVKVVTPVDQLKDLKAYQAAGTAEITQLQVSGLKFTDIKAAFDYAKGRLDLKSVEGTVVEGSKKRHALKGHGQFQIAPLGDVQAEFKLLRMPVATLADMPADKVQGTLSADLTIQGRADKLKELNAKASVSSDHLSFHGVSLDDLFVSMILKDGDLRLPEIRARYEGVPISSSGIVDLKSIQAPEAKLELRDFDISALPKLAAAEHVKLPAISGFFSTDILFQKQSKTASFRVSGNARIERVKSEGIELPTARFHWAADSKKLEVANLDAQLYDGKATGSAKIPFDSQSAGAIDLQVQGLNISQLAHAVHLPIAVSGKVDGTFKGSLQPARADKTRRASLNMDVKSPKLHVQNIPAEQLHGVFDYNNGQIDYKMTGFSLGGTFDVEGKVPLKTEKKDLKQEPNKGRLSIKNLHLSHLARLLGMRTEGLGGVFNLTIDYVQKDLTTLPDGKGRVEIANLKWADALLSEALQGEVVLADQRIHLRGMGGDLAGGTVNLQGAYHLREPGRSWFRMDMDQVDSAQLAAPLLGDKVQGLLAGRIRGRLGDGWSGNADLELGRGKVYGLEVTQWRIPANWSFSPTQNRGTLDVYETSAQLTRGRASGKVSLSLGLSTRVEGFLRLDDVQVQPLLRQTVGATELVGGQGSARFNFKGSNIRSLNDIGGTIVASFKETQALQIPVLKQLAPYLGVGPSTTFQHGTLKGRLSGGKLLIDSLTLKGSVLQVFVSGTATLAERLSLAVVAKTRDIGWPAVRLGPLAVRIPVAGPVPLVVLQEASALLSNQVVYLDVNGTARSPLIRPRTLAILSEEALRFFLMQAKIPVTLDQ